MGGDLPIIRSNEENDFISNLIPKNVSSLTGAWIGLQRNVSDSNFYWIDGTLLREEDSKWKPGQPDNSGGIENCVHVFGSASGGEKGMWNDFPCEISRSYRRNGVAVVCEKPL